MTNLQPRLRTCTGTYWSLPRRGASHNHSKRIFYPAVIYARYNLGIYLSYIFGVSSNLSLRTLQVSQAHRYVSDLDCLQILSFFATESPPTRGWGLPKFHSQWLRFLLPVCGSDVGSWLGQASAHRKSKACFCRAACTEETACISTWPWPHKPVHGFYY